MNNLREKIEKQEKEFKYTKALLKEKFSIDQDTVPEISFETITEGRRRKKNLKRRSFYFKAVPALLMLLLLSIFIFREVSNGNRIDDSSVARTIKKLEKSISVKTKKIANTNSMKQITMIYKSGRAEIAKDAPIPMVWISKKGK